MDEYVLLICTVMLIFGNLAEYIPFIVKYAATNRKEECSMTSWTMWFLWNILCEILTYDKDYSYYVKFMLSISIVLCLLLLGFVLTAKKPKDD